MPDTDGSRSLGDILGAALSPKKKQAGYVNFYGGGQVGAMWPDRATADKYASQGRIACKFIDITEGDYDV